MKSQQTTFLNKHHIIVIPQSTGPFYSYFVRRSYGNYLFFPHGDLEPMFNFFKSQGGIYKVFDINLPFPYMNQRLFDIFGASSIGPEIDFHSDFKIEKMNEEFHDPDLFLNEHSFQLKQIETVFHFSDKTRPETCQQIYHLYRRED